MNKRVSALTLACFATIATIATMGSTPLQAQGLRSPGGAIQGLGSSRTPLPLAAAPAGSQQADYIVAVVNSEPITNNEVRASMARVEGQMRQQGAPVPAPVELARQVLDNLITERALVQQARDTGIKVDDALVDQAEANVARQNGVTVAELRRRVEASGLSQARFRADLRNQQLLNRLRERDVENRVRVSDLDVDQFIREQEGSTEQAGMEINLGHVLVLVPEGASAEVVAQRQARAQDVAERARKGEDFGALARAFSDAQEANSGGLLGLRAAERYPSLFIESTQALPVGGIAGPVRSPAGFHVLKVVERERPGVPGAQVVQSHARHILLRPSPQLSEAAAVARLADYKKRIESGSAEFATLARENSQDGSAKQGGDLGWTNPGQFVPEFEEALDDLKPGQIGGPLISRFGVHLVQLLERREATLSQREQREMARNVLREKKIDEAYANWVRDVRGRAYVEFREPPQ
jgi:peptidyl-prolyl cis-trans isomerase SurA